MRYCHPCRCGRENCVDEKSREDGARRTRRRHGVLSIFEKKQTTKMMRVSQLDGNHTARHSPPRVLPFLLCLHD